MNLKDVVETPLSPKEINQLSRKFGMNLKVVLYDEIINTKDINNLLKKNPDGLVIFYPNYKDGNNISGHYVCMFRKGNTIYFYDSYSDEPDSQKKDVPQRNELYRENVNSLIGLLLNSPYNIDFNHMTHQKLRNNSSTCGRHAIFRLIHQNMNTEQYHKELMRLCKKFKLDPDQLVSVVVS